MTKSQRSYI